MTSVNEPAAARWDFPRTLAATRCLLAAGAARGVSSAVLLKGTGLTAAALDDADELVQADQELAVVRNLLARIGDVPGLGIAAGSLYDFGSLGVFGFAMLSSATVREAITVAIRFFALSSGFLKMTLVEAGDEASVLLDDVDIPLDVRDFIVERDLATLLRLTALSAGAVLADAGRIRLETRLDSRRRRLIAAHVPVFDVTGGTSGNRAVFSRGLLQKPMTTADLTTAQFCLRVSDGILQRRKTMNSVSAQVRSRLAIGGDNFPPIGDVARDLGLSERTLRRRLSAQRTSYRELLDERRAALATELLSTTELSVDRIARRVGYADGASFSRAFVRWHGHAPGVFRGRRR